MSVALQKFINSILFFLLLVALAFSLSFLVSAKMVSSSDFRYDLDDSISTLVLGHSHAACSLNDSLLEHTRNFASGAEAYLFTYVKLKKLLEVNPEINQVFIEFSNNQISYRMDNWTWGEPEMIWQYGKYAHVLPLSEQFAIASRNPKGYLSAFQSGLKQNLKYVLKKKNLIASGDWGGYEKLHKEYKGQIKDVEDSYKDRPKTISKINLSYLQKCKELCDSKNVTFSLIRSPIHANYSFLENEDIFQSIRKDMFNEVPFYDFKSFELDLSDLSDTEHLNYKGARKFSKHFNSHVLSN